MKFIWTVKKPIKGAKTIQWIGIIGIIISIILFFGGTEFNFSRWYIFIPSVLLYIIAMILGAEVKAEREQTTHVYCSCKNEMVADELSFIRDVYIGDRNVVHYKCSKCGKESFWNFDFPVPISLPLYEGDDTIEKYKKQYTN